VRLTLHSLELKLAAGCALVLLALAERALTLALLTRRVQSGTYTREAAYQRYRKSNQRMGVLFGLATVVIAAFAFNPPVLGGFDIFLRELGLFLCSYALAYFFPLALLALLGEWLIYPTLRADLRPEAPAPRARIVSVCKALLFSQLPLMLMFEATGAMYALALTNYRWALPAGAVVFATLRALASTPLYAWGKREVPLERTEWAELGPRIQGWAALAGVRVDEVRVEYLGETGLANAAVSGLWRHTMYLGGSLLANTDWRQRDAVIGHELGHLSLRHMPGNAAMSVLKAALSAGAFAYMDVGGIALFFAYVVRPDEASALDAHYGPASYWPFLGIALGMLWLFVSTLDRWRRHQHELACDRFSVGLVGDPLAKGVVLITISKLAGTSTRARSFTHPTTAKRVRLLMTMALHPPVPLAPWSRWPVPAVVTFANKLQSLTVPLAAAPAIAPLPLAAWSRMPPVPPVPPMPPMLPMPPVPPVPPVVTPEIAAPEPLAAPVSAGVIPPAAPDSAASAMPPAVPAPVAPPDATTGAT
jgi:Zn-dependent protease with chaperone function